MKDINEFKEWLKRMEQYETISGSTAEKVLEFVANQQKEKNELLQEVIDTYENVYHKEDYEHEFKKLSDRAKNSILINET